MSQILLPHSGPWLDSLKGLFFPPACLLCNRFMGLSVRESVCAACRPQLAAAGGMQTTGEEPLDGVFFLYRYGRAARRLVHRIKITGDPRARVWLESELHRLKPALPAIPEAVVPVPSHRRPTLLSMDHGGSALWADALGSFFGVPVVPALRRTQTVPKQTSLTRDRRLAASEASLAVRTKPLEGCRSALLADDVMTTGATARACARTLKKAGVERVILAVVARG